jgi:pimeloyl-ACP methyl ester carboxylesterase
MKTMEVNGATLAVREWGSDGGRPLLFWHALGPAASGATVAEVAPVLAERGNRVVAVDGPGFGASPLLPPERYELEALAGLIEGLIRELRWHRPVLMGHSWGGALAVRAARRVDPSALVLLDSGHIDYGDLPDVDPQKSWDRWLAEARERDAAWPDREAFERDLREGVPRWSDELLDCFLPGTHEQDGRLVGAPAEARAAAMAGLSRARSSDDWPSLAGVPTLLLLATVEPWAEQNRKSLPRFDAAVPHAEVRWLEETSHGILSDVGPDLGRLVADWLDRVAQ